jgi:hypothetical protein
MSHPDATRGALRAWLRDAWLPLLVVIVGYVGVTIVALRPYGYNPTGPIRIGTLLPAERFWRPDTHVEPGVGYDGQWFFYLAHDPLLREPDPESFLDLPAYRYARILYPALAWMLALGQPAAIPWALLAVNLLAVVGGAVACLDLLKQLSASRWLVLAYAFSPPIMIGVSAMLAEPTSMALVVAGLALALRGRHRSAGVVLALAVLAREPSLLVPIGLGLYALGRLDWRRGAAYLLPLAAPAAWHLWILVRLGSLPSTQSQANLGVPFSGAYYRLGLLLGWHPPMLGEPVPSGNVAGEAIIVAASMAIVVLGLLKVFERRDVFAWQLWLQAALALGTTPLVWADLYSYGRVLGLLYFAFGLMVLTSPRRGHLLPARLHEWTTAVPDATKSVSPLIAAITSRMTPAFFTVKRSEKLS